MRRLLPDGLAGRFALLLTAALVAANLLAAGLLSLERVRLEREAREARETERLLSLVPVIEAVDPAARRAIARDASTRATRVWVDAEPLVAEAPRLPRARALARALGEALPGRELRAAILPRRDPGGRERETIAVSVRLGDGEGGQWLNLVTRAERPPPPGAQERAFLVVLLLSLATVLGVGLWFLRRLTLPLARLAAAARAAGQGDRSARVPEEGPREMREAAAAFNDMQARIEGFEAERMRTLAAVGHDLRTPITSLRIRAEMLDEAEAAPMIRTLDEMTVMADGLVAYARGSHPAEAIARTDLGPFLARLCEERGAVFAGAGGEVPARIRPVAMGRAVGNLIDNALRYGKAARVTLAREGGAAVIRIDDDGPGIPPERIAQMFEPFVRGEESRSAETGGAGLGLAIARAVIVAAGGTVTLENRPEGGLRAQVTLPLAAD
ncbi:MAG: ATP-binding protein [Rhodobacteraceae bacterium]|nr:ATP-binding protein [Paracoccaceae bacterium]